jgi:hypothetical protein
MRHSRDRHLCCQRPVLSTKLANVEDIAIIAIDLTKRAKPGGATSAGAKPITTRLSQDQL